MPLEDGDRKEWVMELLRNNRIYFRHRTNLNDQFEFRPSVVLGKNKTEKREYARRLVEKEYPNGLSPANRYQAENEWLRVFENDPNTPKNMLHEILDKLGLLSLSETFESCVLWDRYAAGHTGICVEFDSGKDFFQLAEHVDYQANLPEINLAMDPRKQIRRKAILVKTSVWAEEREWRVIARCMDQKKQERFIAEKNIHDKDIQQFIRDSKGTGYYPFCWDAIKSIITGPKLSNPDQTWIKNLVRENGFSELLMRGVKNHDGGISRFPLQT